MKTKLTSTLAALTAMLLVSCAGTVSTYVPATAGTETGMTRVDGFTEVYTDSTVVPLQRYCSDSKCAPSRNSAAANGPRQFVTTDAGIRVRTARHSPYKVAAEAFDGATDKGIGVMSTIGIWQRRNVNVNTQTPCMDKPFGDIIPGTER
jgi:hypothetical protein